MAMFPYLKKEFEKDRDGYDSSRPSPFKLRLYGFGRCHEEDETDVVPEVEQTAMVNTRAVELLIKGC